MVAVSDSKRRHGHLDPDPLPSHSTLVYIAVVGFTVGLAGFMLALVIYLNRAQPEERCFATATTETNYCRTQLHWSF